MNLTTQDFFKQDIVEGKFKELLGKKSVSFIASVLQIVANDKHLKNADPQSVYTAAATAAVLDLVINKSIGYAWIVPYGKSAQFQIGWKGFVQLALRTQQYKKINVVEVYENQFVSFNALTEELNADFSKTGTGKIIGFAGYFVLNSGFEKLEYWTIEKVTAHGKKYSKSFGYSSSPWKTDFNAMAKKTVLKSIISKWGVLSIELQTAVESDQSTQEKEGDYSYPDNSAKGVDVLQIEEDKQRARIRLHINGSKTHEQLIRVRDMVSAANLQKEYDDKENEIATN